MNSIELLDKDWLHLISNRTVASLARFKYPKFVEWYGETTEDEYFVIRMRKGFLLVGIDETQYGAEANLQVVGIADCSPIFTSITTGIPHIHDILDVLNWELVDDDAYFE
ncbi:hypothetical protein CL634_01275 [bacterium]|nr:hypothetical protein [bacterium]|tara:strand:+ start:156 stop:485 length:330 start_codon:yes stop_codon:yes gene_type:complete